MPLHYRFPLSALTRPLVISTEDLEDLGHDAPDPELAPASDVLETLVTVPHILVKTLEDPKVFGPFPAPWERAGTYVPRLLCQWGGSAGGVPELLAALGAQQLASLSLPTNDEALRYAAWVDQLVRGYGDLELLGFLLAHASRSDMEKHLERMPEAVRGFAREAAALCLAPSEGRALAAALMAAKEDGCAKLQRHLRGEDAVRYAAFLAPVAEEGVIDLFTGRTPSYFAPDHYEQRGKPLRAVGPPVLGVKREQWRRVGGLIAIIAVFLGVSLLLGMAAVFFQR
ncbi:hypothetical protein JYJ95_41155 [Corallococcus exiguus]|uniref:hypothetical protein n=1 Tax=Corallococcus exiguus TaxID=83462 RepID=UPI001A905B44|nr:hypothetical protein [Corallococcus exiguus]MBN8472953.1 hypothetical protein [Corallococcus exiguus]